MMYEPKKDVYDKLSEIAGVNVYYERPEIIEGLETQPTITFRVLENTPVYHLAKNIAWQNISVQVDIWGKNTKATGIIASSVEEKMRELDYLLSGGLVDVPDLEGYSHLVGTFVY